MLTETQLQTHRTLSLRKNWWSMHAPVVEGKEINKGTDMFCNAVRKNKMKYQATLKKNWKQINNAKKLAS